MPTRAKVLEYAVDVDAAGRMTIPGGGQLVPPEGWSADHLLLAALVRCSIDSFAYHARRAGHAVAASGEAQGTITKSGDDGRYRFVENELPTKQPRSAWSTSPATPSDGSGSTSTSSSIVMSTNA